MKSPADKVEMDSRYRRGYLDGFNAVLGLLATGCEPPELVDFLRKELEEWCDSPETGNFEPAPTLERRS